MNNMNKIFNHPDFKNEPKVLHKIDLKWLNDPVFKIKELTLKEFNKKTPKQLGFNNGFWDVDMLIVDGIVVLDRFGDVRPEGRHMLMCWFKKNFKC
jgi:hypothetical protein